MASIDWQPKSWTDPPEDHHEECEDDRCDGECLGNPDDVHPDLQNYEYDEYDD